MSEPIPIIGTLTANGQPIIAGLAFSPPREEGAEVPMVEVHERVQLVTLASSDEDGEGEEEDIDLRVEEMDDDRLVPIDEEEEGGGGREATEFGTMPSMGEGGGGVELMATISEEEHADISEKEEEEGKTTEMPSKEEGEEKVKLETDRPGIGTEFSEEKSEEERPMEVVEEKKEEENEEEGKVAEEAAAPSGMRKMTKEEDEAVQELLKELDEGNRPKEEEAEEEEEEKVLMVVMEEQKVVPSLRKEYENDEGAQIVPEIMPEVVPADRTTTTTTIVVEEERTVTTAVEMANQCQACTSSIEATIFEDNNATAEPISTIEAAAQKAQQPAGAAESTAPLPPRQTSAEQKAAEGTPEKEPAPQERERSPVIVKMRQKTIEKQQAVVETPADEWPSKGVEETREEEKDERKKPIEVIWREEKKVEIYTTEERRGGAEEPAIVEEEKRTTTRTRMAENGGEQADGTERVEEVELRRAVEELQAVQANREEAVEEERAPKQNGAGGGATVIEQKTRKTMKMVVREREAEKAEEWPPGPMENGHQQKRQQQWPDYSNIVVGQKQQQQRQNGGEKENARPIQIQLLPTQQQNAVAYSPGAGKMAVTPAASSLASSPAFPPQQNGTLTRGPGARSPFAMVVDPTMEEDWRLSPKTLSRIKRLRVVMEGSDGVEERMPETGAKDAGEVIHHHPIFVKDTSRFWYKPTISREEAINMLKNKPPGTFVVRDSNSFPGAFGLALKVSQAPAGVTANDGSELVRHFLIEPSTKGVRLKGCSNEPVFGTLAALVYQHSITPLALPSRLILPEYDPASSPEHLNSNQALLERGAACNVTYLCSVDTESLTGPEAVRRSAAFAFELLQRRELRAVPVHFKVSSQGVTLTDNTRSLFFRRHYPVNSVTFAGIDPESRVFDNNNVAQLPPTYVRQAPLFGFVARKLPANGFNGSNTSVENACHIFAELDPDQPASAVVRFIANVMMPAGRVQLQQIHQNANAVH